MTRAASPPQLVVWLITDHKPGHRQQLEGLRQALATRLYLRSYWFDALPLYSVWRNGLARQFPARGLAQEPDWIIVAGHRTHATGLLARHCYGAKLIVLMRPTLPLKCFDACVVPMHDRVSPAPSVFTTMGALNPVQPALKKPGSVLILLGGNSRHFAWSDAQVWSVVEKLMARWPDALIADSRRTPADFKQRLAERWPLQYRDANQHSAAWLMQALGTAETAWVTADSVSMLHEALSAGCRTGLIGLPPLGRKPGKVAAALDILIQAGYVVPFSDKILETRVAPLAVTALPALNESQRIADQLLDYFAVAIPPTEAARKISL